MLYLIVCLSTFTSTPSGLLGYRYVIIRDEDDLIEDDSSLDSTLVLHSLQALRPLLELIGLVDNTLDLDLARI